MSYKDLQHTNAIEVSMSDLIRHPWYEKYANEKNGLEALLYSMGMDVKLPYECMVVQHRSPMTGAIVTCERFSGTERSDSIWKQNLERIKKMK